MEQHEADLSQDMQSAHAAIRDQLPDYVTALIHDQDAAQRYQALARHLETCQTCRADVEELLRLAEQLYAGAVTPAPPHLTFDLPFLAPARPARPWSWDHFGRLSIQLSHEVLETIRTVPQRQYGWAAARSEATVEQGDLRYLYEQQLAQPGSAQSLQLALAVFDDARAADLVHMHVAIDQIDRDPLEQEGATVQIISGDFRQERVTTVTGRTVFNYIPRDLLPTLQIEVRLPIDER